MQFCCVPSGWLDVDASEGRLVFFATTYLEMAGACPPFLLHRLPDFGPALHKAPSIKLARFLARASMHNRAA
jgi:hypothetical protein